MNAFYKARYIALGIICFRAILGYIVTSLFSIFVQKYFSHPSVMFFLAPCDTHMISLFAICVRVTYIFPNEKYTQRADDSSLPLLWEKWMWYISMNIYYEFFSINFYF